MKNETTMQLSVKTGDIWRMDTKEDNYAHIGMITENDGVHIVHYAVFSDVELTNFIEFGFITSTWFFKRFSYVSHITISKKKYIEKLVQSAKEQDHIAYLQLENFFSSFSEKYIEMKDWTKQYNTTKENLLSSALYGFKKALEVYKVGQTSFGEKVFFTNFVQKHIKKEIFRSIQRDEIKVLSV